MAKDVANIVDVGYTKANSLIATCEKLGILKQSNKGKRNRRFIYHSYVDILAKGTELSVDQ